MPEPRSREQRISFLLSRPNRYSLRFLLLGARYCSHFLYPPFLKLRSISFVKFLILKSLTLDFINSDFLWVGRYCKRTIPWRTFSLSSVQNFTISLFDPNPVITRFSELQNYTKKLLSYIRYPLLFMEWNGWQTAALILIDWLIEFSRGHKVETHLKTKEKHH